MNEVISACFTFVQLPGTDTSIAGHVRATVNGIEVKQEWAFSAGPLEDASTPLEWLQMALARACDGV